MYEPHQNLPGSVASSSSLSAPISPPCPRPSPDSVGKINTHSNDITLFETWYAAEHITKILYYNDPTKATQPVLKFYIQPISDMDTNYFAQQLYIIRYAGHHLGASHVPFVAMEPGHGSHFIAGIVIDKTLLIVNPMGLTKHGKFFDYLSRMQEKLDLAIVLSTSILQRDPSSVVSCGPITVEIAKHFSFLTKQQISETLKAAKKTMIKHANGLQYETIELRGTHLLNSFLENLIQHNVLEYKKDIVSLRTQHREIIAQQPENLSFDEEMFFDIYLNSEKIVDQEHNISLSALHSVLIDQEYKEKFDSLQHHIKKAKLLKYGLSKNSLPTSQPFTTANSAMVSGVSSTFLLQGSKAIASPDKRQPKSSYDSLIAKKILCSPVVDRHQIVSEVTEKKRGQGFDDYKDPLISPTVSDEIESSNLEENSQQSAEKTKPFYKKLFCCC